MPFGDGQSKSPLAVDNLVDCVLMRHVGLVFQEGKSRARPRCVLCLTYVQVDSTREKYEHVLDELDRLLSPTTPMATHGKASTIVDCRDTGVIAYVDA